MQLKRSLNVADNNFYYKNNIFVKLNKLKLFSRISIIIIVLCVTMNYVFGSLIFSDDFENGNLTTEGWEIINFPNESNGYFESTLNSEAYIYQNFSNLFNLSDDVWNISINHQRTLASGEGSQYYYNTITVLNSTFSSILIIYLDADIYDDYNSGDLVIRCFDDCSCDEVIYESVGTTDIQNTKIDFFKNNTIQAIRNDGAYVSTTISGCNLTGNYLAIMSRRSGSRTHEFNISKEEFSILKISIISPENHTTNNQPLNVTYNITIDSNCSFYVNNELNQTSNNVQNNTLQYFYTNLSSDGNYNYYINCTSNDGYNKNVVTPLYNYHYHAEPPVILVRYPQFDNTTIFSNYIMNITGNVSDENLFRVNVSIFASNSTVMYNNYSGDLINGTTFFDISKIINTTTWANGFYELFIDTADQHTDKVFFEAINFVEKPEKIDEITGEIIKELVFQSDMPKFIVDKDIILDFIPKTDKISFKFTTDKPELRHYFYFKTEESLIKINSHYPCHYVFSNYWFDCVGLKNPLVEEIDKNTIKIEFDFDGNNEILAESLGGLNENNESILFQIDNCVPNWVCNSYSTCNISDLRQCINVTDLNFCGFEYSGNISEDFPAQSCNYCTSIQSSLISTPLGNGTCNFESSLINFATCCNITKLPTDCIIIDNFAGLLWNFTNDDDGYISIYSKCVGYIPLYDTTDLTEISHDIIGLGLNTIIEIIGLITFFAVGILIYKKIHKR